jgi:hypothetical protein
VIGTYERSGFLLIGQRSLKPGEVVSHGKDPASRGLLIGSFDGAFCVFWTVRPWLESLDFYLRGVRRG